MGDLMRDLAFAFRNLRRVPGTVLVIVASLGLGVGAVTTAYAWIDSFLLRPFPVVRESDRLVGVYTEGPEGAQWSLSYPSYRAFNNEVQSFDGVVVHGNATVSLKVGQDGPERVFAQYVSGDFFEVLGVPAAIGRTFRADDEANVAPVAILSQSFWARRFGSDSSLVGKTVLLNGQGFVVVGVAPSGFG
jgi:hypothetical protein